MPVFCDNVRFVQIKILFRFICLTSIVLDLFLHSNLLFSELKSLPSLKEHLLTRLQRISEEVNEEQRAVQVLEAELTRTDGELMRAEQEMERTRSEMDLVRDEIHQLELSLHPHSSNKLQHATVRWNRLFAPILIGAGLLVTALYWTQSGSADLI